MSEIGPISLNETHFYSRPCGRGDQLLQVNYMKVTDFYSRPCGRGDVFLFSIGYTKLSISTHAPAGGATTSLTTSTLRFSISTHAPAGGATEGHSLGLEGRQDFYSRPCGRGDMAAQNTPRTASLFLLTPLREGRRVSRSDRPALENFYSRPCGRGDSCGRRQRRRSRISTHAPAGGATPSQSSENANRTLFLLTPLREGRRVLCAVVQCDR